MDRWIVSALHVGQKTGLMCTTVYLWCHLFCIRPGRMTETIFCVACILVEIVWSYRLTLTLTPDLFLSLQWLISVELHRPPTPEESPKNSKFFNHILPRIRAQNLWVTRLYHWVGFSFWYKHLTTFNTTQL
jgi:hypothetical protein